MGDPPFFNRSERAAVADVRRAGEKEEGFEDMEDVDFTAMPELTEIVCGEGCFHSGLTLICEGVCVIWG